ncbi:MAG TPA: sensor domain-containing diguanylate cyclase [Terriglobales bacterium]|nr:sensor domain-containing diguanylate cyclase [Terriglobales bacterium]
MPESPDPSPSRTIFRFDLLSVALVGAFAIVLIFLLDTGSLAEWIARHNDTKIDEIIFSCIALLVVVGLFAARKWLGASRFLAQYKEASQFSPEVSRVKDAQQRDLFGIAVALAVSLVIVFFFDTGFIAEWIAEHKDSKVDEAIVTGVILLVGLLLFSIRRWLELTEQVVRYEELHRKTTKLNREITVLGELGESLQCCLSAEEAHHLITASAQALFPGCSGAVCIIANSRDVVEVVASWGASAAHPAHFELKDCLALRRGRLHRFDGEPASLCCAHLGNDRPVGSMCLPMMAHGETLGLLCISPGHKPERRGTEQINAEERLARALAEQSALALANLKMRDVLQMQSTRDPLTGLFNRRHMEEAFERELRRAARKQTPVCVLMMDVDHFKSLNDTFGHEAGDAVLRSFGGLLKGHFRAEDIVCRYGGEEFTVILSEASLEAAEERSKALCEAARQMLVHHRGKPLRSISISIGVAALGEHGTTTDALLHAADSALYLAKEQGRDRVIIAGRSELPKGGASSLVASKGLR